MKHIKYLIPFFLIGLFFACKKENLTIEQSSNTTTEIQLKFLDEYILSDNIIVNGTLVGGLSGIDYKNGTYYLACDDSGNPRFYKANITLDSDNITNIDIDELVIIENTGEHLDLESIIFDTASTKVLLTSEGSINKGKDPLFFSVDQQGNNIEQFEVPEYYKADSEQKPIHNGVFEGLTESFDANGYWIATELPLEADGIVPTPTEADSPVRITYFNKLTERPETQFVYQLDKIARPPSPIDGFAVNGLTDLLAYAPNKFFVIERSFSTGNGIQSITIKIYSVDSSSTSNTLDELSLKTATYTPAKKELLFNFDTVRNRLTNGIIDNVEGICFGPTLSNGNQSIILVVDNDFNQQGNRLNQFILMELID